MAQIVRCRFDKSLAFQVTECRAVPYPDATSLRLLLPTLAEFARDLLPGAFDNFRIMRRQIRAAECQIEITLRSCLIPGRKDSFSSSRVSRVQAFAREILAIHRVKPIPPSH